MELTGKNVFITGSTRGIGKGIALAFAKRGANVVLNGRSAISPELVQEFTDLGVKAISVCGDISDFASCTAMIAEATEALGSVDILVNNAGVTADKLMLKMTAEDFEKVLKINLTGTFNMTQQVIKAMSKQRQGAIINLSSVVGLVGNIGQANYAASKAGAIGFTKSVAREVAGRNIRVNAIAPGFIETEMTEVLSEKVKTASIAQIPMKRFGTVEEVADIAIFLAEQEYLTGQVIAIDGGMTMNG
ncbi:MULTISPECIES: 3-oxoacyl-[acyl-carrier-protein] reductase [unclassified Enterococcus]|uniref:3-oxoacyl-[acyl-carrier-protein] reductase n=1 Tax=unclassified Enterococcus TaxID=2608891 RepID=UPI0015538CD4|nr:MULTISPECIES: 3-oxoacyl-[acyl-carrier-protein] reductase [unclassified Enterococcus]MBS7577294.1 3-oxoacyl-[acyl-carrier-protein] reductase [Enterococcus sp. MMGLQ5-2]MBS7584613.1 3-oxoacyl-[acyl-carrier-protein] reductase [Enterococcus sp. MMGLQ5-1]NPD12468.1 3-oxoacyl-[acyl-carrier-protein] reductase [Enterococcus sp. MMGLQ5-1]NPD37128.1 3-oxoacyl-[acyl-carrier-protein] reductase [Enterococcus sp. MMGLQ5-2]